LAHTLASAAFPTAIRLFAFRLAEIHDRSAVPMRSALDVKIAFKTDGSVVRTLQTSISPRVSAVIRRPEMSTDDPQDLV